MKKTYQYVLMILLILFQCSSAFALVTERFGGSNATLDHSGKMKTAWFGYYSGHGYPDSKILYHYNSGDRRNAVYIDVSDIAPNSQIVKAVYVMPYDTEDYWSFSNADFQEGLSIYRILDPSGTGMWNSNSIGTRYKDGETNLPWSSSNGTFSDCIDPTPVATVYSIERGPKQFYHFDVTSLVREWVNDPATNMGITFDDSVPSDAMTDPSFRPYLEITYEKANSDRQAQPTNFNVFYRSGQSFITWTELPYDGAFFNMKYRIYRHVNPITESNLDQAELIAEVDQNSGRNIARTEVRQKSDSSYSTIHNYVINEGDGEISEDTGLFVYTCKQAATVYYAVTSVREGNENQDDFLYDNALDSPVSEAVAMPESIVQNSFMKNGTLVQEVVHWADDTMSYKVGHGFNFMVNISDDYQANPSEPVYLEVGLGGRSTRYYNTWCANKAIYVRPDTYMPPTQYMPYDGYKYDSLQTWWSGCSSTYKTQQKINDGVFVPYTENRILYYIEFVKNRYNIDENRVYLRGGSMGGTGAISLGLKYPDVFASISSTVGCPNWRLNIHKVDENYNVTKEGWRTDANRLWGTQDKNTLHENGTPVWDWMNAGWYLLNHIDKESPFLEMNNGKRDGSVMHFPIPQFYNDIRESKHGLAARFFDGGHSGYGGSFTRRFGDIVKNESFPALDDVSIDDDPGGVHPGTGIALIDDFTNMTFSGDLSGTINGYYDIEWSRKLKQFSTSSSADDMVDLPQQYELALRLENSASVSQATADITPRRLQNFIVVPGETYFWQNKALSTDTIVQTGSVVADSYGLITVQDFIIEKQNLGNKLIITGSQGSVPYDLNQDGVVNVQDAILCINAVLDGSNLSSADVNGDGSVNVMDVMVIINAILG